MRYCDILIGLCGDSKALLYVGVAQLVRVLA